MIGGDFYRALEDKFRGSRELIAARLRVYLPLVQPLAAAHPALKAFDLGCGRGEWLELLAEQGIAAYGMDLDAGMLAACQARGLQVSQGDALAHLQTLPAQSLLLISAFHVVEHLVLADLQRLLAEAQRVLVPDGLLILETPNPENLLVGSAHFYIDPTHQRPLPSQLLAFLAEHHGFGRVEVLRLQHEPRLEDAAAPVALFDVLAGVSPDYAILAWPARSPAAGSPPPVGVSLHQLASRYESQQLQRGEAQLRLLQAAQTQVAAALAQSAAAEAQAGIALEQSGQAQAQAGTALELSGQAQTQASTALEQSRETLAQVISALEVSRLAAAQAEARMRQSEIRALQAEAHARAAAEQVAEATASARQLQDQLAAVHASRSWRITRPLRWLAARLRRFSRL